MKKIYSVSLLLVMLCAIVVKSVAQDTVKTTLRQIIHKNQDAVDAIAMYPTETRKIIFQATGYPEVLEKLNSMQQNSQQTFESYIAKCNHKVQDQIWNLTRYDNLIAELSAKQKMTKTELDTIMRTYPEEIRKTAIKQHKKNYDVLVKINNLNNSSDKDFEQLLGLYPPMVATAFRQLLQMPEVLSILIHHPQYTKAIGEVYRKNPERVIHKTDSLNLLLTQKNAQEVNDWTQSLKTNPETQQEYTRAAQEYAQDNGYQPQDYNANVTPDVTNYSTNSFNWWTGYPTWYPDNYWDPYPYWYDWGFYYSSGNHVVFFGLPSEYFMEWFFYYPEHFSKYPELSNHYYNYYNRHHTSTNSNSISHSVNVWQTRNKNIVNQDWDNDNTNRTMRFKEFGQMEKERVKYNAKNPQEQLGSFEYLQMESNTYHNLSSAVPKIKQGADEKNTEVVKVKPLVKQPKVTVANNYKARQQAKTSTQPKSGNVSTKQPTQNFNQKRTAQQYHQNTWQQTQPQPQRETTTPQQHESRPVEQPSRQNTQPQHATNSKR